MLVRCLLCLEQYNNENTYTNLTISLCCQTCKFWGMTVGTINGSNYTGRTFIGFHGAVPIELKPIYVNTGSEIWQLYHGDVLSVSKNKE